MSAEPKWLPSDCHRPAVETKGCAPRVKRVCLRSMGHDKGKDNVKKHAKRRKKTERLALAKTKAAAAAK